MLRSTALPLSVSLAIAAFGISAHPARAQSPCGPNDPGVVDLAPVLSAPPPLPSYEQPPIPGPGYLWVPGYWAYSNGYYWVPGNWVEPPAPDLLWTPGYWAWLNGAYVFSAGYWGPQVGFYGGIHYGYGYDGTGYQGGRWDHGVFNYNRVVNNFGTVQITNFYNQPVGNAAPGRASFNGGPGGIAARPTAAEINAYRDHRAPPTAAQVQHIATARTDPALNAAINHGHPPMPASPRPNDMRGQAAPPGPAVAAPHDNAAAHDHAPPATPAANEAHPEPYSGSRPGPHPEAHPEAHPDPHPDSRPEPRANLRAEPHPVPPAMHGPAEFHNAPFRVPAPSRDTPHDLPPGAPRPAPHAQPGFMQHAAPPPGGFQARPGPPEHTAPHPMPPGPHNGPDDRRQP